MVKETCIRAYADPVQIKACRKKVSLNENTFAQISSVFSLAGNDVRLKILFLLKEEKELCPCDIADMLGMSVPAISQHLRKMKDGRIIEPKRKGQTIFYTLNPGNLNMLRPFFKHLETSNKNRSLYEQ